MKIKLKMIDDVKKVVSLAEKFHGDVDIKSGRFVVDAKSLMGIFALDLSRPLEIECRNRDNDEIYEQGFYNAMKQFAVEE